MLASDVVLHADAKLAFIDFATFDVVTTVAVPLITAFPNLFTNAFNDKLDADAIATEGDQTATLNAEILVLAEIAATPPACLLELDVVVVLQIILATNSLLTLADADNAVDILQLAVASLVVLPVAASEAKAVKEILFNLNAEAAPAKVV